MTFVIVSHELASIFDVADDAIFLDAKTKTFWIKGIQTFSLSELKTP